MRQAAPARSAPYAKPDPRSSPHNSAVRRLAARDIGRARGLIRCQPSVMNLESFSKARPRARIQLDCKGDQDAIAWIDSVWRTRHSGNCLLVFEDSAADLGPGGDSESPPAAEANAETESTWTPLRSADYPAAANRPAGRLAPTKAGDTHVVLAWNRLGNALLSSGFFEFQILPPYNVFAQVVARGRNRRLSRKGIQVDYGR